MPSSESAPASSASSPGGGPLLECVQAVLGGPAQRRPVDLARLPRVARPLDGADHGVQRAQLLVVAAEPLGQPAARLSRRAVARPPEPQVGRGVTQLGPRGLGVPVEPSSPAPPSEQDRDEQQQEAAHDQHREQQHHEARRRRPAVARPTVQVVGDDLLVVVHDHLVAHDDRVVGQEPLGRGGGRGRIQPAIPPHIAHRTRRGRDRRRRRRSRPPSPPSPCRGR
jgi:hypothetical protein